MIYSKTHNGIAHVCTSAACVRGRPGSNAISIPAVLAAPVSADQQAPTCKHLSSPGRRCGTLLKSVPRLLMQMMSICDAH